MKSAPRERVDVAREELELVAVPVPAGVPRGGDAVVSVVAPGAPRVDVGRVDQVGRDPAGEFAGLGQLAEDLGGGMGPVCMGVSPVVGGGVGITRPAARAWNA